ncbi:glycosyltransferase family 4 protein [Candidatus Falkowbacteria bacterium]|nr:glycosyltransferase family 4 protein [Candidatus Falkowbacteria bacterium]
MAKILYIVTQSELGGAQRYISDLAKYFSGNGDDVWVAAGGNDALFELLKNAGIKAIKLRNLVREINPLKDLQALLELKKIISDLHPDIVHLNSSKAGVLGAVAAKVASVKKIIYTVHGFVFNEPMNRMQKIFYLLAEKISAHFKNYIICVSEFDYQQALINKICSPKKLITIHNGIDEIKFSSKEEAKKELNLPPNKIIIGCIANFYASKGLEYLIEAARIVKEKIPGVLFVIIGDGQEKNNLISKIKKNDLAENFILTGKINQAERCLKAFDLYACSSVKEGFPYSLLEAMTAGLPIVATKVGGIPEMIKNNYSGILVEPANPDELAKAIINLCQNKSLAMHLASQALAEYHQYFNFDTMIAKTKKVYVT